MTTTPTPTPGTRVRGHAAPGDLVCNPARRRPRPWRVLAARADNADDFLLVDPATGVISRAALTGRWVYA